MEELKPDVIEKLRIESEIKFINGIRTNFSKQADDVFENIKNGKKSTKMDYFILTTTNQKQIDEALKFDSIKQNIGSGKISYEDIDFLINNLGDVKEFDKALRKAFYRKADEINLHYAKTHPDEFTKEEIQEKAEKLQAHQPLNEILEENLTM